MNSTMQKKTKTTSESTNSQPVKSDTSENKNNKEANIVVATTSTVGNSTFSPAKVSTNPTEKLR